jgi:hypothetical protein
VAVPDRHGFDHLPDRYGQAELRCISCGAKGPPWKWPEARRAQHARAHANGGTASEAERRLAETLAERERAARRQTHSERRVVPRPRACANPYCSTVFQPHRVTARFCSSRCRVATHRDRVTHTPPTSGRKEHDREKQPGHNEAPLVARSSRSEAVTP